MNQEKFKKIDKAVFLDRDGTINKDVGYLYKPIDFQWIDGAIESIKLLKKKQFMVIVITNQSGIGRGYYKNEDVNILHEWINLELIKHKTKIDDFFFSGDLPSEQTSSRRKPSPKMINEAIIKHKLDRSKCFMIGDKNTDMESAKNAKIKGFLFKGKNLLDRIVNILKQQNS